MSSLGELGFERSEEVSEETGGIVEDSEEMLEVERAGGVVEDSEEMLEAEERTGEVVADSEDIGGAAEPETDAITEERRGSEEVADEEVEEEVEEDSAGMEAGNNSAVPELDNRTNTDFPATRQPAAEKLFRFPQGRIKQIMKLDPEVGMVNQEAIFLVNRATEQFIQCLAEEAFHHTNASKKKTIMIEHVNTAIESVDELAFLDGAMED